MNKFYTAQEVADKLKIKKTTVYELIKRGELSSSKIGKQLRVSEEQVAQYLDGAAQISTAAQTRDYQPESSLLKRDYLLHSSGLIISGQSSPALDLLLNQLPSTPGSLPVLQSHMNTYNGLYSLFRKSPPGLCYRFPGGYREPCSRSFPDSNPVLPVSGRFLCKKRKSQKYPGFFRSYTGRHYFCKPRKRKQPKSSS